MGTLYFIAKSSILTFVIVCLLQVEFQSKSLEDRLMGYIRQQLAPKVLGVDTTYINPKDYRITPEEISEIRQKIYESESLKGIQTKARELLLKEMAEIFKKPSDDSNKEEAKDK